MTCQFTLKSLLLLHVCAAVLFIGMYPLSNTLFRELSLTHSVKLVSFSMGVFGGAATTAVLRKRVHLLWAVIGGIGVWHIIVLATLAWGFGVPLKWIY